MEVSCFLTKSLLIMKGSLSALVISQKIFSNNVWGI